MRSRRAGRVTGPGHSSAASPDSQSSLLERLRRASSPSPAKAPSVWFELGKGMGAQAAQRLKGVRTFPLSCQVEELRYSGDQRAFPKFFTLGSRTEAIIRSMPSGQGWKELQKNSASWPDLTQRRAERRRKARPDDRVRRAPPAIEVGARFGFQAEASLAAPRSRAQSLLGASGPSLTSEPRGSAGAKGGNGNAGGGCEVRGASRGRGGRGAQPGWRRAESPES